MLRTATFHRVTYRRKLIMGGEREPMLIVILTSVGLVMLGQSVPCFILAGLVWAVGVPSFRQMAKADPYMSLIYRRQLNYQGYYPARSRVRVATRSPAVGFVTYGLPAALVLAVYLRYWGF